MHITENKRLKEVQILLGFKSQSEFASVLGIKQGSLSDIYREKQGVKVSDSIKRVLEKEYSINIEWLETGEGEMLKSTVEVQNIEAPIIDINYEHKGVPYYDIDVTASIVESFSDVKEKPAYYVNFQPFNDCDAVFPVYGESMLPYFHPGDMVFVKLITNIHSMLWGESYLIITNANCDNLRTIKNVYISDDRQSFILRSTNPRFAGDTIIACSDVLKIFLVKGSVNRKLL